VIHITYLRTELPHELHVAIAYVMHTKLTRDISVATANDTQLGSAGRSCGIGSYVIISAFSCAVVVTLSPRC